MHTQTFLAGNQASMQRPYPWISPTGTALLRTSRSSRRSSGISLRCRWRPHHAGRRAAAGGGLRPPCMPWHRSPWRRRRDGAWHPAALARGAPNGAQQVLKSDSKLRCVAVARRRVCQPAMRAVRRLVRLLSQASVAQPLCPATTPVLLCANRTMRCRRMVRRCCVPNLRSESLDSLKPFCYSHPCCPERRSTERVDRLVGRLTARVSRECLAGLCVCVCVCACVGVSVTARKRIERLFGN